MPVALLIAPVPGALRASLLKMLGDSGCAELESALLAHAERWARVAAPGGVHLVRERDVREPVVPEPRVREPPDAGSGALIAERASRLLEGHQGPLLIVRPGLPRLGPQHAAAALGDLGAGCDLVIGPTIDGGFYLVGLARRPSERLSLEDLLLGGQDAVTAAATAATRAGLELGILRAERALQRPADVRAALADPLLPEPFASILRSRA